MLTLPAIVACIVSPLPLVNSSSRSRSCLRKMPARSPNAAGAPCHISRWPTAIVSLSAADTGAATSHVTATSANTSRAACSMARLLPSRRMLEMCAT